MVPGQVVVVPEQNAAGVKPEAPQLAALHWAVEVLHFPAPSQTFVPPQGEPTVQRLSVLLASMGEQVPIPFRLQALQAPQLALPQQTLSTQLPELHWLAPVQAVPFGLRPQLLGVVPWQVVGDRQSVSLVQVVLQAFVPQTYGSHCFVAAIAQLPLPLQFAGSVNVDPLHIWDPHDVFVSACWQVPLPVQLPVFPQGMLAETGHFPCSSAPPEGMLAHVPALPGTLQAWQVPHDGEAQQMPSTHVRPVKQSFVTVQLFPCETKFPHLLVIGSQFVPVAHCELTVQVVLQSVVPLHENCPHELVVAVLHTPLPSHVRALVRVVEPVGQLAPTQTVPAE